MLRKLVTAVGLASLIFFAVFGMISFAFLFYCLFQFAYFG